MNAVIEKIGKYPNHHLILASRLGDIKRTKKILDWEFNQLKQGTLKYCFALPKDIIILKTNNGMSFRIRASKIPQSYATTQVINVIDNHNQKVCNPKIMIKNIYVKGKEKNGGEKNGNDITHF